ncbi:TSUP family transporter [Brachybacterium sillae]|uniref:TSUP family transporter n=1 Tax=Brachybacterium sillae TaxID=2810536 RepID=UPI00217CC60A|nr:TSUP family transporter [Brachybacterium sillae]
MPPLPSPLLDLLSSVGPGTLALLLLATLVAGWVDAVVGGGGLVQLPALLMGLPAQASTAAVLGTNKLASAAGTSVATVSYLRRVRPVAVVAIPLVICAGVGSAAGAALASLIPRAAMSPVVLVVLIGVGAYTLRRPALGLVHAPSVHGREAALRAAAIGGGVGLYDGALGPGTGSFLILAMVALLGFGFLEASVHAKLANLTTNLAALAVFGVSGEILWLLGALLAAANITGGLLGARLALRLGSGFVRTVFLVVVAVLALRLAADSAALLPDGLAPWRA